MKTIFSIALAATMLFGATGCLKTNSAQFSNNVNNSVKAVTAGTPINASLGQTDEISSANKSSKYSNGAPEQIAAVESSMKPPEEIWFLNKLPDPPNVVPPTAEETADDIETPAPPPYKMRMLMDTEYYEEEVEEKTGAHKGWLGLYRKKGGYFLMPTTVKVKAVNHDLRDEKNSDEQTGREVVSSVKLPNVFLLKNAPMLRAGEITTVFYGNEENSEGINRQYRRAFKFKGKTYTLAVEDSTAEAGDFLTGRSKMTLRVGKTKQVIYQPDGCGDCAWNLCWVGDLDRDGKLDFMLDLNSHYNSTCHVLFLSSQAGKGEIVRDVAEICQQGC